MVGLDVVVAILPLGAAAYVVAERIQVPYPVLLVCAGLLVGALPWVQAPSLSPDIVFGVFLPPLLYYAAHFVSPSDLRTHARPIGLLAVVLVFATTTAVAVVFTLLVPGVPLAVAVAAGALVAPTDPVAATSVFRRAGAPERLVTIVEGEGLINDGAALVLYGSAVAAAVAGSLQASTMAWDLLVAPGGGVVLGLGIALISVGVRRRLDEPLVDIAISLATPYLTYILAESVGLSGILAVVAAGIYVGSRTRSIYGAASRLQAYAFLDVLVFVLNAVLFSLVGVELARTVHQVPGLSAPRVAAVALAVVGTVVGIRLAWLLIGPAAMRGRRLGSRYTWQERVAVGWSGMRGGVSLAAALALPLKVDDGSPFPMRGLILVVSAALIVSTLVVQGMSLSWLLRRLHIGRENHLDNERRARLAATRAAMDLLDERMADGVSDDTVASLRTVYTTRLHRLEHDLSEVGADVLADGYDALRLEVIGAERAVVMALHDEGRISGEVLRHIEHDLDLEETRLRHR